MTFFGVPSTGTYILSPWPLVLPVSFDRYMMLSINILILEMDPSKVNLKGVIDFS